MRRERLEPGPMPPELAPLVEAEQHRPGAPQEARTRIAHGLAGGLAAVALKAATEGSLTTANPVTGAASVAGAGATSGVTLKVVLLAATLTVGSGAGLLLSGVLNPGSERLPANLEPLAAPPRSPPTIELPALDPEEDPLGTYLDLSDLDEVKEAPTAAAPAPAPAAVVDATGDRRLLREAQAHLRAGAAGRALEVLDRHEEQYPDSHFAEERGALRVLALRASGDEAVARARAATFLERYPQSLFRTAVRQTLPGDGSVEPSPIPPQKPLDDGSPR